MNELDYIYGDLNKNNIYYNKEESDFDTIMQLAAIEGKLFFIFENEIYYTTNGNLSGYIIKDIE